MNLLLDTHVFIWHVMADDRLGMQHRRILTDPANTLFLSAASIFEMSIKVANGKLDLPHHYKNNLLLIYEEHDLFRSTSRRNMPMQPDNCRALTAINLTGCWPRNQL